MNKDGKKTGIFKSLDGKEYTVAGFTRMMAVRIEEAVRTNWELKEKRPLPERPTYSVDGENAFGGEEIVYYHTKDTIETEEEKKEWADYIALQDEFENRVYTQMMYAAMNCVEIPMETLKEYAIQHKRDTGIALPSPEEYEARVKRIYVEHIVLCDSTDEMMRLLSEAMKISGMISDEEAKNALESFRNQTTEQDSEPAERPDTSESAGNS